MGHPLVTSINLPKTAQIARCTFAPFLLAVARIHAQRVYCADSVRDAFTFARRISAKSATVADHACTGTVPLATNGPRFLSTRGRQVQAFNRLQVSRFISMHSMPYGTAGVFRSLRLAFVASRLCAGEQRGQALTAPSPPSRRSRALVQRSPRKCPRYPIPYQTPGRLRR